MYGRTSYKVDTWKNGVVGPYSDKAMYGELLLD
jgi:hypothetical protein